MRNKFFWGVLIPGVLTLQIGCSGSRVSMLEEQVAQEQSEKAALQTRVDSLRSNLAKMQTDYDKMRMEVALKEQAITQLSQQLSDLRDQTQAQQVKAETPEPKQAATETMASLSGDFKADYENALKLFNQRKYIDAAALFRALVESDPEHKLADNCRYWLGECYYAQRQYGMAVAEFEKVLTYANSGKADDAQLKIGLCYLQAKKYPEARQELNRLMAVYPMSEYVVRARKILDSIP